MRKVLILTEKKGWHFNQLKKSFLKKEVILEAHNLIDMSLSFINNENKIFIKTKEMKDFTDIFVRHIPSGNLEEVVTYLNILKILNRKGLNVMNSAEHIELTVDKSMTTSLLNENGIRTPKTWIIKGKKEAKKLVRELLKSYLLICKPIFGSQGKDIIKIEELKDFNRVINKTNIYYLQEFINTNPFHDYRLLVIRGKKESKVFSMIRYGKSFINNFSKGAKCVPVKLDSQLVEIALSVSKILDIPFCGVDIIKQEEKIFVIEVNGIPAWRGLQSIINENISDIVIETFLDRSMIDSKLSVKPTF